MAINLCKNRIHHAWIGQLAMKMTNIANCRSKTKTQRLVKIFCRQKSETDSGGILF
jgi:hypothetical protein